jgi:hypothetical protein
MYRGVEFYIVDNGYKVSSDAIVHLDLNNALITDEDIKIILLGTHPKELH